MENSSLKDLQNCELDILKRFINVCDKLNLNYFLIGGSLIGAVRHKGFIPWDDDIDVCMLRSYYEIFLKEAQNYLDKKYFLQTYLTDENYSNCFAKIRNSETTFLEKSVSDRDMNHGVYIDIFPIDNYYRYNKLKVKLIQYSLYYDYYKKSNNKIKVIFNELAKVIYGNKSKKELCIRLDKIYTKHNNKKSKYVINYSGAWGVKRERHLISDFLGYEKVKFGNIQVKIPKGYYQILKDSYGDYMKLPPKEQQVSHHYSDIIDTKNSYKNYIKFN